MYFGGEKGRGKAHTGLDRTVDPLHLNYVKGTSLL